MINAWIPVKRIGQIVDEAEKAYKREDWITIGELSAINTGVWFQDGVAYCWALHRDGALPFDEIETISDGQS
jgi:hypothetical protein